jgi:hypothetical protein
VPTQKTVDTEAKEVDLECRLGGREGTGVENPSKPESLGDGDEEEDEDEEEGEVAPSPHSLPPEDLPSHEDYFSRQAGISVGADQPKCPQMGTRASPIALPQSDLTLVSSDLQGMSVALVVTGTTHLLGVS